MKLVASFIIEDDDLTDDAIEEIIGQAAYALGADWSKWQRRQVPVEVEEPKKRLKK